MTSNLLMLCDNVDVQEMNVTSPYCDADFGAANGRNFVGKPRQAGG
jgi:hypothetical protein